MYNCTYLKNALQKMFTSNHCLHFKQTLISLDCTSQEKCQKPNFLCANVLAGSIGIRHQRQQSMCKLKGCKAWTSTCKKFCAKNGTVSSATAALGFAAVAGSSLAGLY